MNTQKQPTIRESGFAAGASDAARTESTPCPYPAGSWQAVDWEAGYEGGAAYFYDNYPNC